jgi:hypothetical protein
MKRALSVTASSSILHNVSSVFVDQTAMTHDQHEMLRAINLNVWRGLQVAVS